MAAASVYMEDTERDGRRSAAAPLFSYWSTVKPALHETLIVICEAQILPLNTLFGFLIYDYIKSRFLLSICCHPKTSFVFRKALLQIKLPKKKLDEVSGLGAKATVVYRPV